MDVVMDTYRYLDFVCVHGRVLVHVYVRVPIHLCEFRHSYFNYQLPTPIFGVVNGKLSTFKRPYFRSMFGL